VLATERLPRNCLICLENEQFSACVLYCLSDVSERLEKAAALFLIVLSHLLKTVEQRKQLILSISTKWYSNIFEKVLLRFALGVADTRV